MIKDPAAIFSHRGLKMLIEAIQSGNTSPLIQAANVDAGLNDPEVDQIVEQYYEEKAKREPEEIKEITLSEYAEELQEEPEVIVEEEVEEPVHEVVVKKPRRRSPKTPEQIAQMKEANLLYRSNPEYFENRWKEWIEATEQVLRSGGPLRARDISLRLKIDHDIEIPTSTISNRLENMMKRGAQIERTERGLYGYISHVNH